MAGVHTLFEKKNALLVDKAPDLLLHIKLSPIFWALLVKYEVIQKHYADDIQVRYTYSLLCELKISLILISFIVGDTRPGLSKVGNRVSAT